jgi:16S rRNA (uracil1498-N3)-methyltransferase
LDEFGAAAEQAVMPPRFLVSPEILSGSRAVLTGTELHHLRVRRLRAGKEVILSDGRGRQRTGVVVALERRKAVIALMPDMPPVRESHLRLVLAQAALKADKMDLIVEKTTELGVSEIVVFNCERSIGHASPHRHVRWQRIAGGAMKQSQRSTMPALVGPISFEQLLSRPEPLRLLFWEGEFVASLLDVKTGAPEAILAVVGPEGGFSAVEVEQASAHGFHTVGLGPRTLRAETAAVVVTALCQFRWGDLNRRQP